MSLAVSLTLNSHNNDSNESGRYNTNLCGSISWHKNTVLYFSLYSWYEYGISNINKKQQKIGPDQNEAGFRSINISTATSQSSQVVKLMNWEGEVSSYFTIIATGYRLLPASRRDQEFPIDSSNPFLLFQSMSTVF